MIASAVNKSSQALGCGAAQPGREPTDEVLSLLPCHHRSSRRDPGGYAWAGRTERPDRSRWVPALLDHGHSQVGDLVL
jgi:hypothetical protein